jgi:hypothetical protein
MRHKEQQDWDELSQSCLLVLAKVNTMFDTTDSFVKLSRERMPLEVVELYPFDSAPGNYEFWDKVNPCGKSHGAQQDHYLLCLEDDIDDVDDEENRTADWDTPSNPASVRRKVSAYYRGFLWCRGVEEVEDLATAIRGHPMMLSEFQRLCMGGFLVGPGPKFQAFGNTLLNGKRTNFRAKM